VMLQQATVAAVKDYFAKFTSRWPSIADLAAAEDGEVMAAWAGLGYYARARNLLACARVVADMGAFPDTEEDLRRLPGLGAYTAAAVAAIAFGRRAVVVDANVERVVARLFAIETPLPAARGAIREGAARITPYDRPGDFAQAMMDLGATICTVRSPRCMLCPLSADCLAYRAGEPERLPVWLGAIRAGTLPGGWAADDGVALRFHGRELVRVVSSRPGTAALRVDALDGELVRQRLEPELLGGASSPRDAPVPDAIRELRDLRQRLRR